LCGLELSVQQLMELGEHTRFEKIFQLEQAFSTRFFEYSREEEWMKNAVGDVEDWIKMEGMATWQIKMALAAILTETYNGSFQCSFSSLSLII
jgi:hypothetical protein